MAFTVHLLRDSDLFVDVGANVGTYSVLASGVSGAKTIALEPVPSTFDKLVDHINLNRINGLVDARQIGVSSSPGRLSFTADKGATNTVVADYSYRNAIDAKVDTLVD